MNFRIWIPVARKFKLKKKARKNTITTTTFHNFQFQMTGMIDRKRIKIKNKTKKKKKNASCINQLKLSIMLLQEGVISHVTHADYNTAANKPK